MASCVTDRATTGKEKKNVNVRISRWVVVLLFAVLTAGCAQLRELTTPSAPYVSEEWAALLQEIRAYERRIGFVDTDNFADLTEEHEAFVFCGHASRLVLPYSYEDPAIKWLESETEEECRARGRDADVYYGAVEAWGEIGTPVTPAMISSKLDRFIYLVIHEDCHDQFGLPYGIEEALCDLITYKGMEVFTREKFGPRASEHKAILHYADAQSRITRATIVYYTQLEALYARYERKEISSDLLLQERAVIFRNAAQPLAWTKGDLNNVGIANDMTYSRHYPFLESVFDALGRDVARTVAFFRRVDEIKPDPEDIMKQHRVTQGSVAFIRAYETAVVETIRKALADPATGGKAAK